MKHRSPLITLAAVALAFAIMFIVNMTASPPARSSTALELNPGNPQVMVDSESLTAALSDGDESL